MLSRRDLMRSGGLAVLMLTSASGAWAQEKKVTLFRVITVKDEIVIGLTADELKALGGSDAGAIAHALAQKGDMTVWQYNVHRGANGEFQEARYLEVLMSGTATALFNRFRRVSAA